MRNVDHNVIYHPFSLTKELQLRYQKLSERFIDLTRGVSTGSYLIFDLWTVDSL